MKKIYIFSILILSVAIIFIGWDVYKSTNQRKNNQHYFTSEWIYENAEPNDIGIIVDLFDKLTYFKVVGFTSDHRLVIRYGNTPSAINKSKLGSMIFLSNGSQVYPSHIWVSDLLNNKKIWNAELSILSQTEILKIKSTYQVYYYKNHKRKGDYHESITFSFDSFIFIMMFFAIFLFTQVYQKLKANNITKAKFITPFIVFLSAVLLAKFFTIAWFDVLFNLFLIKNIITFFPLWWLIRWSNKKWGDSDFGKREIIKFLVIASFGFVAEYAGGHFFNYLFIKVAEGRSYYQFDQFSNIMGWYKMWLLFGIANFLSNLTSYVIHLRKNEKSFIESATLDSLSQSNIASIQSRINPHFLYNALNSIASLARTEPQKTELMVHELTNFYTEFADKTNTPIITLHEELKILKSYINIEKIRFGDKLNVQFSVPDEALGVEIPAFTLQPLVENAIKYGYDQDRDQINIHIYISKSDNETRIRVIDFGTPFSDQIESGYGITSIRKKLKWLMPESHELTFVNSPQKYVEIVLKLKKI